MKKAILSLALMSFALTAGAQGTTTKYFYGDKARNSRTNPCKGYTDQICAVITTTTPGLTDDISPILPGLGNGITSARSAVSPITIWRVPLRISDSEYQSIKALEFQYSDLKVIRGLEDEVTDDDEID